MWSDILKINRKFINLAQPRYVESEPTHSNPYIPKHGGKHLRARTKHDNPYTDDKGWGEHLWGLARDLPDVENRELDGIAEYESWWKLLSHLQGRTQNWDWHSEWAYELFQLRDKFPELRVPAGIRVYRGLENSLRFGSGIEGLDWFSQKDYQDKVGEIISAGMREELNAEQVVNRLTEIPLTYHPTGIYQSWSYDRLAANEFGWVISTITDADSFIFSKEFSREVLNQLPVGKDSADPMNSEFELLGRGSSYEINIYWSKVNMNGLLKRFPNSFKEKLVKDNAELVSEFISQKEPIWWDDFDNWLEHFNSPYRQ